MNKIFIKSLLIALASCASMQAYLGDIVGDVLQGTANTVSAVGNTAVNVTEDVVGRPYYVENGRRYYVRNGQRYYVEEGRPYDIEYEVVEKPGYRVERISDIDNNPEEDLTVQERTEE